MRRDLHHRWLKMKRHLRSVGTSQRALRAAARAIRGIAAARDCLCSPYVGLAA